MSIINYLVMALVATISSLRPYLTHLQAAFTAATDLYLITLFM